MDFGLGNLMVRPVRSMSCFYIMLLWPDIFLHVHYDIDQALTISTTAARDTLHAGAPFGK